MDETLKQIGGLLLGSIPTIICFLLLFGLYTVLVHKPLTRVLSERRDRTQGAIEKARADIQSAESRTAEYEQKLREARLALFKAQEARRAKASQARAVAIPKRGSERKHKLTKRVQQSSRTKWPRNVRWRAKPDAWRQRSFVPCLHRRWARRVDDETSISEICDFGVACDHSPLWRMGTSAIWRAGSRR